jgi:hypothetical protein
VIVISGALVLVALVLLVLGLTMSDLEFVYGSIAVSLVSFVFLIIGILQRRGEQPAPATPEVSTAGAAGAAPAPDAVPVRGGGAKRGSAGPVPVVEDVTTDEDLDEDEWGGGAVLIVPGRPRYHVDGCRYLTGKDVEEIDVLDAREDGFTPCGVCKPDLALEELADDEEQLDDDVVDTGVPGVTEPEPEPVPARRRGGARASRAAVEVPAAPARQRATAKAPAKAPAKAVKSAAPAATGASRAKVVVIPDRDRFHTGQCRFVRDALGTEELSKTQASRQGYRACGVCKP